MINNPILMDSGVYVWEKYDVLNLYKAQTETNGAIDPPSDLTGSGYEGYTLDTATGEFTLTGNVITTVPNYFASTSKSKIYKHTVVTITIGGTPTTSGSTQTLQSYTAINAVKESTQKGSTYYGTVTSEDEAAYPADGEQDGYWYVLVGKTGAEGGGNSPVLQAKSVMPSESSQNVTPDAGYDGLSKVTVGAIQTETKTVTANGTVTPSTGKYLKQVTVNVPTSSSPNLQTKSVSPSESEQSVTPDTGYDGLSRVTVGAIQTETKTVTANGTVTPSSGKYLKQVTVNVPASGIDTSDATATADDIAAGKTAYADGKKLEGSLAEYLEGTNATFASNYTEVSDASATNFLCRGLNQGAKILRDGSYANVYVKKTEFGDASAADVAQGKTFTSSAGLKITGTHVCSGGIDTSDATATASDISENKTAYVNGEKVTGSLPPVNNLNFNAINASWDSQNSKLMLSGKNLFRCIFPESATSTMYCTGDKLGDATAADVAQGKTFTSSSGLKITGTHVCSGGGTTPTLQSKTVSPSTSQQIITPDSGYDGLSRVTVNGDANLVAGNIKSGVSIFGVAGSFEGSGGGGGSSDNNCEAYHITSASATLNFKTTGTVKVWGYGSKKSNYTTTVYAFVGDGYYAGSSYGTPSKTSASFSINADGTLNGLPSGLEAVDLLVTIGV